MQPLTLLVPMPPSVNGLYRNGKQGRHITKGYAAWIEEAGWALIRQPRPAEPIASDVRLSLTLGPRNRRADLSNKCKAVEDLLVKHRVIADDSQVTDLHLRWDDEVRGCQIDIEGAR